MTVGGTEGGDKEHLKSGVRIQPCLGGEGGGRRDGGHHPAAWTRSQGSACVLRLHLIQVIRQVSSEQYFFQKIMNAL